MENKYLNEERYQNNKKKISKIALIILIVGILIGGSLIVVGLVKQNGVNSNYSEESKESLQEKMESEKKNLNLKKSELEAKRTSALETEKKNLESKKEELKSKGITYDNFANYEDGEAYDLYVITKALDPSFDYCAFDEYKNNSLTLKYCSIVNKEDEDSKNLSVINDALDESFNHCAFSECQNNSLTSKYCSYKEQLDDFTDFNKEFDSFDSVPFYMYGAFVIISSCMISFAIFMFTKRREIMAFSAQQVMPVAKEGIETMAPTIGTIGKEIAKGITEGIRETKEDEE